LISEEIRQTWIKQIGNQKKGLVVGLKEKPNSQKELR
jgi:hypothetical protein